MNKDRIIEIARFRGIADLACKSCGVVSALESIVYEFNGPRVKASCPDCGAYIKFMPTTKSWRIFKNKTEGLVEIEKIDNGYLDWALKNRTDIPADLRNNIEQLIERRTTDPASFAEPVRDLDTKKESEALERRKFLVSEIAKITEENRARVADLNPAWDSVQVKKIENILSAKVLIINGYERELYRVEKSIKEFSK